MIKRLGYKNNRWHPGTFYKDWNNFLETVEGKEHIKKIRADEEALQQHKKNRINYKEELKRTDLTMKQRQHYRKKLEELKE
tara:strand:- start:753 stop:995 length:243 start_codon:yes stop_codon:yes gene_type:complete